MYDGVIGEFIFHRGVTAEFRKLEPLDKPAAWKAVEWSSNPNDFAALLSDKLADPKHAPAVEVRLLNLMASTVKPVGVLPLDATADPAQVALSNQAHRLFYAGAFAKSLELYKQLLKDRPDDPVVIFDYATCLIRLSTYPAASDAFSRVVQLRPKLPWGYLNRGVAEHLQGKLKDAVKDYSAALELLPNGNAAALNNRALARRELRDLTTARKAKNDAKAAMEVDKHYAPVPYFNDALIWTGLGDKRTADERIAAGKILVVPAE